MAWVRSLRSVSSSREPRRTADSGRWLGVAREAAWAASRAALAAVSASLGATSTVAWPLAWALAGLGTSRSRSSGWSRKPGTRPAPRRRRPVGDMPRMGANSVGLLHALLHEYVCRVSRGGSESCSGDAWLCMSVAGPVGAAAENPFRGFARGSVFGRRRQPGKFSCGGARDHTEIALSPRTAGASKPRSFASSTAHKCEYRAPAVHEGPHSWTAIAISGCRFTVGSYPPSALGARRLSLVMRSWRRAHAPILRPALAGRDAGRSPIALSLSLIHISEPTR